MQTATEKNGSGKSNEEPVIVEDSRGEESRQEKESVEEILTEIINTNKITEDTQAEQVPEDTVDPGDAAGEEKNEAEESLIQETDISSDQNDTAADPNAADDDGVVEATATVTQTREETGTSKIFEAIQKIIQSQGDHPVEPVTGKIFEAIQKMTQSHADLPGQPVTEEKSTPDITGGLLVISANEIMQNQVIWANPEDGLQQAFAKMQQTDAGYIMIGQNGALEGIVSKSDITKAMSPFLLPIFAKWRRPLDDATLKIRIKWIMSRPVRTIKPQTSLATIIEHMNRFRVRCLPVLDEEGNVLGLVTAFDIFQTLLKSNSNTCMTEEAPAELAKTASSTERT